MTEFPLARFTTNRTLDDAIAIFDQRIKDAQRIYNRHRASFVERPCFVCECTDFDSCPAFHETYGVVQCRRCGTCFVNPAPSEAALEDYYNNCECNRQLAQIYRKRYQGSANYILDDRVEKLLEIFQAQDRMAIRVLEVGCNSGAFLARLRHFTRERLHNVSLEAWGVDIDRNATSNPVEPDLRLTSEPLSDLVARGEQFDVIVHFELIEHIVDPRALMRDMHALLRPGGAMFFSTPNALGLENVATGYNGLRLLAHAVFPPMHINAFSTQNMLPFVLGCGFQLASLETPGRLDVDIVANSLTEDSPDVYRTLASQSEAVQGLVQALVVELRASSHMRVLLRRP